MNIYLKTIFDKLSKIWNINTSKVKLFFDIANQYRTNQNNIKTQKYIVEEAQ